MIPTLLFAAATLAPGLPAALALRGRGAEGRWGEVLVEGLVLGAVWWLTLGLVVATVDDLRALPLVVLTLVFAAATGGLAWRRGIALPRPAPTAVGVAVAGVLLIAAWLRRDPFYLLYQTSDMSEYIRAGNALADGGGFSGWFVRLFQVPLALSSMLLGRDDTVAVVPFIGLLVAVFAGSLGARLARPVVGLVVLVVATVDPVAVWFSRFPASETLYAALLLGIVVLLLAALQRGDHASAVVAGAACGLLIVTRGNGVLVAPLLLVTLPVCALLVPPGAQRLLTSFTLAAVASLFAGFVYDSATQNAYFVEQLSYVTPARLLPWVDSLHRPVEAVLWGLGVAAVTLAVAAASLRLNHRVVRAAGDDATGPPVTRAVLPVLAVGAAVVLLVALPAGVLANSLARFGPATLAAAAAGLAVAVVGGTALPGPVRPVVVLAVLVGGGFALFQAARLEDAAYAPYHLYWERYLFSEVLPAMAILGALGVDAALRALKGVDRRVVAGVGVAALGVGAGVSLRMGAEARERRLFDRAYEQVAALDEVLEDRDLPIVYSGLAPEQLPPAWFTWNTYRVLATPLEESFGRELLVSIPAANAPDPVLSDPEVDRVLARARVSRAYLLRVRPPGADAPAGEGRRVGTVRVRIPVYDRQPDPDDEQWRVFELVVDVSEVTLPT